MVEHWVELYRWGSYLAITEFSAILGTSGFITCQWRPTIKEESLSEIKWINRIHPDDKCYTQEITLRQKNGQKKQFEYMKWSSSQFLKKLSNQLQCASYLNSEVASVSRSQTFVSSHVMHNPLQGLATQDYRNLRKPCKIMISACAHAFGFKMVWCQKCFRTFLFRTMRHLILLLYTPHVCLFCS